MKILVLKSSGNIHGNTSTLVDEFIRGAKENGHDIEVIDLVKSHINGCTGCNACGMNGTCVQRDDMTKVYMNKLLDSDALVLSGPTYYFNIPAQLKVFIDRFYSRTYTITNKHMKTAFITTCWNSDEETISIIRTYINKLNDYMSFESIGNIYATGCTSVNTTKRSYLKEAYELGKKFK